MSPPTMISSKLAVLRRNASPASRSWSSATPTRCTVPPAAVATLASLPFNTASAVLRRAAWQGPQPVAPKYRATSWCPSARWGRSSGPSSWFRSSLRTLARRRVGRDGDESHARSIFGNEDQGGRVELEAPRFPEPSEEPRFERVRAVAPDGRAHDLLDAQRVTPKHVWAAVPVAEAPPAGARRVRDEADRRSPPRDEILSGRVGGSAWRGWWYL